ncbi:RNA-dependent RNA polymerase [Heterobasidion partitivirus 8]|uniref:RNA-dependent RNA polymerase n=1 Tax=Heterobasidion partitivirus 8 TaxID=1249677 RepID=K7T9Z2_9VIRU|nr:RNA-dependent RNA polymerase [Heterobasidion partitivirus 8]AFW17810.1 RNA-dependent RNA polymerase [Heterobasidion partitivirus 8]
MLSKVRDFFHEKLSRLLLQHSIFQSNDKDEEQTLLENQSSDVKRIYNSIHYSFQTDDTQAAYEDQYQHIKHVLEDKDRLSNFPAEFYLPYDTTTTPDNRVPPSGIDQLPYVYKRTNVVTATDEVPETGYPIQNRLLRLIRSRYPQYLPHVRTFTRPLGTTDATVSDFFKPQHPSRLVDPSRISHVMKHVMNKMAITPYLPIHFVDTQYDKRPLSTGTGYYNRRSHEANIHALYSHPKEYENKRTSKGYYINAFLESARSLVHWIKSYGNPFRSKPADPRESLKKFFLQRPTMLFTRNHISKILGALKQRPVYAVDDLFLTLESMVTFPAHTIARKIECCIMYGYETIRGSNVQLDRLAQRYNSFFTIDWSGFDQRLPWVIVLLFFTEFLPRLLVINHGYAPTYDFPSYPDLTTEMMYQRLSNILSFLATWYFNMVFITADGFAYVRRFAGVPSGLLNTQFLDSFGNLFLIIDALIEFGAQDEEIDSILLLIMGDDNSGFTIWSIARLEQFITFLESYALTRYGMVMSKTKSLVTVLRHKIQTLSYTCNFGRPLRPIPELVAHLVFPEREFKPQFMSARAVGMAWASCAQDKTFHDFCRDVFYEYLEESVPVDNTNIAWIQSHLPGYLRVDPEVTKMIDLNVFPSFLHVSQKLSRWQGPLSYQPKWDLAHFINQPDVIPDDSITMFEYMQEHSLSLDIQFDLFSA